MKKYILGLIISAVSLFAQGQTPWVVYNSAGSLTGEIRLQERRTNGTDMVIIAAPQNVPTTIRWYWPAIDGSAGDILTTDGAGNLTFGSGVFYKDGGNSFGANASIGLNDNYSLTFKTDNAARWVLTNTGMWVPGLHATYDIGTSSVHMRTLYGQSAEFMIAGGTSFGDFVSTRKINLCDSAGSSGCWDMTAQGSFVSSSSITIRDNGGSRWITGSRAILGTPTNSTLVYSNLSPALRSISGGDAVDDSTLPSLGGASGRWEKAWLKDADMSGFTRMEGRLQIVNTTPVPTTRGGMEFGYDPTGGGDGWGSIEVYEPGSTTSRSFVIYARDTTVYTGTSPTQRWVFASDGTFQPYANVTYNIGTDALRPDRVYAYNFDGAPAGATGNYISTRKIQVTDLAGGTGFYYMDAGVTASLMSYLRFIDPGGDTILELSRQFSGSTTNMATFDVGIQPKTNNTRPLGSSSLRWSDFHTTNATLYGTITIPTGAVNGYVLTSNGSGVATWQASGGGSSPPFVDTTAIVKGSVDASKLLAFEVDGFTTATTRTLTPQNASYTIAGTDISQTFGGTQTFTNGIEFASSIGSKLMLYSSGASNKYQLAVASGQMRFITDFSNSTFGFGYGHSGGYTEIASIGNGRFDIKTLWLYSSAGIVVQAHMDPQAGGTYDLGNLLRWRTVYATTADFSSTGTFGGAITASGGISTSSGTNSTIYIGSGNFYLRSFSGADASCGGVTDGWAGIRTDTNELQTCIGGNLRRGGLSNALGFTGTANVKAAGAGNCSFTYSVGILTSTTC